MFKGLLAVPMNSIPYSGFKFYFYHLLLNKYQLIMGNNTSPLEIMLCGSLGGVLATLFTYPLEYLKRRRIH